MQQPTAMTRTNVFHLTAPPGSERRARKANTRVTHLQGSSPGTIAIAATRASLAHRWESE